MLKELEKPCLIPPPNSLGINGSVSKSRTSREERRRLMDEKSKAIEERGRVLAEQRRKMKERRRTLDQDFLQMEQRSLMLEESRRLLELSINIDSNFSSTLPRNQEPPSPPRCLMKNYKAVDGDRKQEPSGQAKDGDVKDCILKLKNGPPKSEVISVKRESCLLKAKDKFEASNKSLEKTCTVKKVSSPFTTWRSRAELRDKLNQKKKELAERRASRVLK